MKAQCLPFGQIPHTTKLFTDFLSWSPPIRQFYSRSPFLQEWLKDETSALRYDPARRERVSAILERQNKVWSASPKTLANVARLRAGAAAMVTGQQVGLLGGPVFALYKALTAVKLAEQACAAGVDCVPVFWLATTDHDLAEVNHISLPGADGSLQELASPTRGVPDAPVGAVTFGPEIEPLVEAAAGLLGDSPVMTLLRQAYRPGENLGSAFARLFAGLFADWGVILLDASDPALHAVAEPVYRASIEGVVELDDALLARDRELETAGYHQQVKISSSSTLLFTLRDGARVPIHRRTNGVSQTTDFLMGEERVSRAELLQHISAVPQDFSPNVLLRPLVQDYLLPTLAYTGGAAEVAYFAQADVLYRALLGRTTPIIPRFSATLIEAKPQSLLERYRLALTDLFQGPQQVREILAKRALPQDVQAAFEQADAALKKSLSVIQESLAGLDKTLVEAAANAGSKMHHQLDQLRARAARAELHKSEIIDRHAALLGNALYPNKTLQEREIAGVYFVARQGTELLHTLYETIHTDCFDHQVVSL